MSHAVQTALSQNGAFPARGGSGSASGGARGGRAGGGRSGAGRRRQRPPGLCPLSLRLCHGSAALRPGVVACPVPGRARPRALRPPRAGRAGAGAGAGPGGRGGPARAAPLQRGDAAARRRRRPTLRHVLRPVVGTERGPARPGPGPPPASSPLTWRRRAGPGRAPGRPRGRSRGDWRGRAAPGAGQGWDGEREPRVCWPGPRRPPPSQSHGLR